MFGILESVYNYVLGFTFRSVIIKFCLFYGLWFVTTEAMQYLQSLVPDSSSLNSAFSSIPNEIWFFLDLL